MAFAKLDSGLVGSSLWCERDDVRILFVTMLSMSNATGFVKGSRGGLIRLANIVPPPDLPDPFDILEAPDFDSSDLKRSPENQGRRIKEVPGGFLILNYEFYRNKRDEEARREQNRQAQAKFKSKRKLTPVSTGKQRSALVSTGKQDKPQSAHAEAEAEADIKPSAVSLKGRQPPADPASFVNDYDEAKRLICERILNGKDPNRLWSVDADQNLLKHLPMPRLEIERVAWYLGLSNDGSPELEARKPKTETGLMAFWGDEVTRANAYWEKRFGWREKLKGAG